MKITKYFTPYSQSFTICLRDQRLGEITISRHMKLDGSLIWEPAYINWAGCGNQSPKQAVVFCDALTMARHLADCLENNISPSVEIQGEIVGEFQP